MRRYDAVAVGSGINSLVAAALLAKRLEGLRARAKHVARRRDSTAEITEPGFLHEVYSSWHPLFTGSAAYAELKGDLDARGLEYLNTELATATLFPDGRSVFLTTSHEENVNALGPGWERTVAEFLPNADIAFGLLGTELWSRDGAKLGWKALRRFGRRGLVEFAGKTSTSCRDWTAETFEDERVHGLFAPWVLHTGLGPDAASSGFMAQVIGVAIELGGMPVPRGGGVKLVEALRRDRRGRRGRVRGRPGGRARAWSSSTGDRCADGGRRGDRGGARGAGERDPAAALRAAPGRRRAGGRGGAAVSLRARRDADPLRALGAAGLAGGLAARADSDRPPDSRAGRRLARGERGRARATARGGDRGGRPADGRRSVTGAGGPLDSLDPAPGGPLAAEGRCGRRARRQRRRGRGS